MKAEYPKHLAIRVSNETSDRLKLAATDLGVSVSDLVRQLIEDRLAD